MESTISFSSVVAALRRMTSRICARSTPFSSAPRLAKRSMHAMAPRRSRRSTAIFVAEEKTLTAPFASSANCSPINAKAAVMSGVSESSKPWICASNAFLSMSVSFPLKCDSPTAPRRPFRRRATSGIPNHSTKNAPASQLCARTGVSRGRGGRPGARPRGRRSGGGRGRGRGAAARPGARPCRSLCARRSRNRGSARRARRTGGRA